MGLWNVILSQSLWALQLFSRVYDLVSYITELNRFENIFLLSLFVFINIIFLFIQEAKAKASTWGLLSIKTIRNPLDFSLIRAKRLQEK